MDITSNVTLRTGRQMPVIGLGTWELTHDTADVIKRALDNGYRMIDTSGDYGTQPGIAKGLKQSGRDRRDYYIVTKIEEDDNAYQAAKHNLKELGLEYADLMLIHRPPEDGVGVDLWHGLLRARDEGLIIDAGVSNYSVDQIQALIDSTGEVPVVNQIEWSPFGHSREMLGYCQENDIIIQAYSPLTRGEKIHDDILEEIADHYGKTPAQILVRWNLEIGTVPLPKANQIDHLEDDIDVFDFRLTSRDIERLSSLNRAYSALGSLPYI